MTKNELWKLIHSSFKFYKKKKNLSTVKAFCIQTNKQKTLYLLPHNQYDQMQWTLEYHIKKPSSSHIQYNDNIW